MSERIDKVKVVTYNIHRCHGLDRKVRPSRIVEVLREINADIIALQEVVCVEGGQREHDQARYIADELGMHFCLGENRKHWGGAYGNVVLSRFRVREWTNYDLSVSGREPRGCLRADVEVSPDRVLHIFNVHLGTALLERRHQGRKLINEAILNNNRLEGARIMLGDFNEWTRGLTTRLLNAHLKSADIRAHLRRSKTYPGVLPFLHLDHIYFDEHLEVERLSLHKSRTALVASDHLPLVAEFKFNGNKPNGSE
ncbi:MAG TPA: endonuclease/exonuclease/phosphatase family protein [Blastocatellia bacterium]|nr:endonuclease/exonuclease/phosphatase family protein [Blastocatellia bacterium]